MTETPKTSAIPGFKELLMGPPKTGKTYSIRTAAETDLETCILFTEPSMITVSDIPCPKLHFKYIPMNNMSWKSFRDLAKNVEIMDNESLQKLPKGTGGSGKAVFFAIIDTLNDFVCDRCGKKLGDTTTWGTDRLLVFDCLTGLSKISRALTVGYKPIPTQPDWGVMQETIDQLVYKIVMDLTCHFIMIAHVEPEKDEVTGGVKLYPSTLGRKLGPKLPSYFHDVIYAYRTGNEFYWTTVRNDADVGARNLPLEGKMIPSVPMILDCWKKKGGAV